ncbi:unnamed protein product [Kuraishia capsulata CBS 1993]|uniref:Uncharacterized protein n=1 Tax=Kuraishia capsulata CBS 1993 TaxID=1382522 RepID=W6MFL4_9ASCO|nr:uncharacterized protein KUCA_T00000108001 [Kuraishia capsulata CBS 1993]CDK24148.1 unnamed protein product [Kuraishia capsulata CBS 1993]
MSTFKSQVKKPFLNLTPRARLLQVIRLGSAALSVIFLLIIICLDLKSMPVARLDCSHVEVANGLFSALQSTVSTGAVGVFEGSDVSLTTSQVLILTEYVQQQVEDAPQFIDSNMMNWCFGNYNYTSEVVNGETFYKKKPLFYKCTDVDKNYVFDYRGELSTIGLNIILAYAYSDSSFSAESLTDSVQYQPDEAYLKTLNERRKSTKAVPGLFYSTVCLQTLLLVLGIIYYGKRNYAKDDTDMPMVIRQCFAVLSLTAFLTFLAGLCLTTKIYFEIQTSVRQELGAFGLSVHLGKSWFGMTWTNMVICLLSMLGWCGPLWCGNIQPKKSLAENDVYMRERDYIGTPLRNRAAGFDTFAFTPSSDEYLAEHKQLSSENTDHGTTYDFSEQSTESPDLGRSLTLGKSKYTRERSQSLGKLLNPSGIPRSNSQKYKGVVSFRDGDYGRDIFLDENNGLVFGDAVSFEEHYMHDGT